MMTHDLYCDHVDGREELLDQLSDGMLTPAQQQTLYKLLQHLSDVRNDFRIDQVPTYEIEGAGDNTALETWSCPVCYTTHRDLIDVYEVV